MRLGSKFGLGQSHVAPGRDATTPPLAATIRSTTSLATVQRREHLDVGREHFAHRRWGAAAEQLRLADGSGQIDAIGLEELAIARMLVGDQEEAESAWARAHESYLRHDDARGAARCAFWLGLVLVLRGEMARGGGWIGRAHEVLGDHEECAERGLLLLSTGLSAMFDDRADDAAAAFGEAGAIGRRTDDADVVALSQLGEGQSLLRRGRADEGLELLDRAMTAVEAGVLTPVLTGIIYCAVIEECQRAFDVARARQWTTALTRWCDAQPDLVAYRGQCLVYRAEVVQRHGDWEAALDEAGRARDQLAAPPGHPATGMALYRIGELYRLRGEFDAAYAAYQEANTWGFSPQPGLPLLRLAQGDVEAAATTIRRVLDDASDVPTRCRILPAAVRILCVGAELDDAEHAADELAGRARELDAPLLTAHAHHCQGLLRLARHEPQPSLEPLASALHAWCDLQAPYEEALTRIAIGTAYRELDDLDSAQLELSTARTLLTRLGAMPDVDRLDALRDVGDHDAHGLSLRELQVLRLLATGATNRAIGDELYISTRTVDRHVSNLYTKLGVSSRAAAVTYAHQHRLT